MNNLKGICISLVRVLTRLQGKFILRCHFEVRQQLVWVLAGTTADICAAERVPIIDYRFASVVGASPPKSLVTPDPGLYLPVHGKHLRVLEHLVLLILAASTARMLVEVSN